MENKKSAFQTPTSSTSQDKPNFESVLKHQHNTDPQQFRVLQYGYKLSNNHPHLNPNIYHQHQFYKTTNQQYNIQANPMHQHFNKQTPPHYQYQYQVKTQPIYQKNNLAHPHQIYQQNSQVWTPQIPNQPLKIDSVVTTPPAQVRTLKDVVNDRRNKGGNTQLKSPIVKRILDAPVTLQGWLHKQGSEGLMLWKKRWFVLSEYCLFYYKSDEEEKLLGSILLPSYKVSICGPEDKVNKKFAFKCEHANMRTYILAADSQELMLQWVRVLNLASLLQSCSEPEQNTSIILYNQSNDNSDSGFNQSLTTRNTPLHIHSSSNATELSNSSQPELNQYNQPLYANAPPKPRRLNDGGYSSPSPDVLERCYNEPKYVTLQPPTYLPNLKHMTKSPSVVYSNQDFASIKQVDYSSERRTPDTYGRSKSNIKSRIPSDYEDVYAEQYIYKRPLSPLAYNNSKTTMSIPLQRSYNPSSMLGSSRNMSMAQSMRKSPNVIPRPHSADFLEYEVNNRQVNKPMRPKSSLDINRNLSSDYFYSEERYAEKMRKSAQYLTKLPKNRPPSRFENDNTYPLMRSNTQPLTYNTSILTPIEYFPKEPQPVRSRSVLSEGSLSKELDMDFNIHPHHHHHTDRYNPIGNHEPIYDYDYDPFTRSASARLASIEQRIHGDGTRASMNKEGEKKREESMKRLLEWKQRMLQSPLNRKVNQAIKPSYTKSDLYYKNQENGYKMMDGYMDSRNIHNFHPYNSYSSDDEENVDGIKETKQAGRTLDRISAESAPYTTTVSVLDSQSDTPNNSHTHSTMLDDTEDTHTKNIAQLSPCCSEFSDQQNIIEIKSNGALVKSILAEFEKKSERDSVSTPQTPQKDLEAIIEENYMAMTPKKSILAMIDHSSHLKSELEENSYVEMTKGIHTSLLDKFTLQDYQPYELVCVTEGQIEPLYMELHQPKSKLHMLDLKTDILLSASATASPQAPPTPPPPPPPPDLLQSPDSKKSLDFDADDDSNKNLELLDIPSHPRFSLSDNFRPASYYLGASQIVPEHQDSSDSELVSPPPIPRSPPPSLDDDIEISSKSKECKNYNPDSPYMLANKLRFNKLMNQSMISNETSSLCSTDTDLRISRLSQNSDSDLDSHSTPIATKINSFERKKKRRPVSEDICNKIASNDYFNDSSHDYENMFIKSSLLMLSPIHSKELSSDSAVTKTVTALTVTPTSSSNFQSDEVDFSHHQAIAMNDSHFFDTDKQDNTFITHSAPYYYSDLSVNMSEQMEGSVITLNNQRGGALNGKRDITHIVNPIRCNGRLRNYQEDEQTYNIKLASEARSVSVDFLNLTDKSGQIDKKNLYESDTLKRLKVMDSISSLQSNPEMRNLYPVRNNSTNANSGKFNDPSDLLRRSYSLEGLLENVLNDNEIHLPSEHEHGPEPKQQQAEEAEDEDIDIDIDVDEEENSRNVAEEGSYLWEEDAIWRERLRNASQRCKSLDDLECVGGESKKVKKSPRSITRDVTYVNDNIYNMPLKDQQQQQQKYQNVSIKDEDDEVKRCRRDKENAFIIDREKLRQWDLMSSAPSDSEGVVSNNNSARAITDDAGGNLTTDPDSQEPASGSISLITSDNYSRIAPNTRLCVPNSQSKSISNLRSHDSDYSLSNCRPLDYYQSQREINPPEVKQKVWNDKISVSAGDLLGRTHEELVLLLIQLRRQSTNTYHAIETCYNDIDNIQGQLHLMDASKRLESLQKLEQIKQHLLDLEKQYEKGKPLVNLVDNMVKLGSLYRSPQEKLNYNHPYVQERIEFNQYIQERKLLAEEQKDWKRLNLNHNQLQEKVHQLYQLDCLIQEESGKLQGLQQDKEEIERALSGLKNRLLKGFNNDPVKIEQAKKQQAILENELSRVHTMLAQNSKKLEETVAGNARLEQELLVLKQKLQMNNNRHTSSPQFSHNGDSLPGIIGTRNMETDLHRVQQIVGDLQRQRQELSMQVRQLTDRSNNLQQIKPTSVSTPSGHENKKKVHSLWRETDLDTMDIIDHGENSVSSLNTTAPLYINTDLKQSSDDFYNYSHSDDSSQNLVSHEKQEIKTVRIVKRESERRQRDREKVNTSSGKWDTLVEEEDVRTTIIPKAQSSTNITSTIEETNTNLIKTSSTPSVSPITDEKLPELSPVFKSEAARQIITEVTFQDQPKHLNRRVIPKEKRRHYTAPNNNLIMKSLNQFPTDDEFDKMLLERRARDDLDMERALRQRIDAPDVVRSTLSNKELKYNESTIDNLLGTPNKISIPERYVPEQVPQLSAEEQEHRMKKVESIKKMLSDTTILSASTANLATDESAEHSENSNKAATTKIIEEKKQREHLLQLNQILAKQVMEMSKIVAVNALAKLPLESQQSNYEDDDLSPVTPLPLYQQRDNFYS